MANTQRASSPTFVGRREEMARLEALLDGIRSGSSATALIAGEAGIGKTRIIEELAQRAAALDAVVLGGGCVHRGDEVLPYAPFVEILTDLVRRCGVGEVLELAGPTADELARLAPALAGGGPLPPHSSAAPGRLYQALTELLGGLARRRPVVLVVEDVHWADHSTRDLLMLLARQLRGRVLLLLSHRTDEVPEPPQLRRFVAELQRGGAQRIGLAPLTREDQARQLSGILGVPPSRDLVDRVYQRAEGNPFFAEELLALGEAAVPANVRDLLLARLAALPEATRAVLRAAAVAGRRVTHDLLAVLTSLAEQELDDALRPAVAAHVLLGEDAASGTYRFRHALLRDAIAETLLPGEAARLHRRIAEALTADPALGGDPAGRSAGRIARHWAAAGDLPRTLQASYAAGQEAEAALAFNEALAHYDRAIGLLDAVPNAAALLPEPPYRVLWFAAEAAHLAAHPDRAAELIRAALDVVDDRHLHHRAYLHERLGRYLWMAADSEAALREYQRAVELDTPDVSCWRAAILSGYGQMLMLAGRFAESVPWCEEAIAIAQQVDGARGTEGHARNNLGVNLASLGDVEAGIAQLQLARTIAEEEFDEIDDIARAIVNLVSVLFDAGRFEQAADTALEGIAVADRLGLQRRKGVWARCSAAECLMILGRMDQAAELLAEAATFEPAGIDAMRLAFCQGTLALRGGALPEAIDRLQRARKAAGRIPDGVLQAPLHATLVDALVWSGRADEALRVAAEGAARMLPDEDPAICVPLYASAAFAAAEAGDVEAVRTWVTRAEQAQTRDADLKPPAAASLLTARAEARRAAGESAASAWSAAAAAWAAIGDRYGTAYARWREAEAALVDADRTRAAECLAAARQLADAVGARHLVAAIDRTATRARLRRSHAGSDAFHLTPREREVLELLADGRTDRQIGQTLFISHRTAERHVANILAKVGAATRSEAAAVAHRSGMVR